MLASLIAAGVVPVRAASAAGVIPAGIDSLMGQFDSARSELRDARIELRLTEDRLETDLERRSRFDGTISDLDSRLDDERARVGSLSALAYIDAGGESDSRTDAVATMLAALSSDLRATRRDLDDASRGRGVADHRVERSTRDVERQREVVGRLEDSARRVGAALEAELSIEHASTLTAPSFAAAMRAAAIVNVEDPSCAVTPAILLGASRILSNHGRSQDRTTDDVGTTAPDYRVPFSPSRPDSDGGSIDGSLDSDLRSGPFLLEPSVARTHGADGDGDGAFDVDNIFDAALTFTRALCAQDPHLDQSDRLLAAVTQLTGNVSQARAIIGAAGRLSRSTSIGLGDVPEDPRTALAIRLMADRSEVEQTREGSIDDLLAWSRSRLGTPYSQCLGGDSRPEDPECPPGTDRFGHGFFDCSGFVHAAYEEIGIALPSTTEVMALDPSLMATTVSEEFDITTVRPGDLLLMDGHVALWSGDGSIIHASGGRLSEEPLPDWVRNGTFAVLRPIAI